MGSMTAVQAPVEDLVEALPDGVVVTQAEAMDKYRFDWSRDQSAGSLSRWSGPRTPARCRRRCAGQPTTA